jgi:hypothetical protein
LHTTCPEEKGFRLFILNPKKRDISAYEKWVLFCLGNKKIHPMWCQDEFQPNTLRENLEYYFAFYLKKIYKKTHRLTGLDSLEKAPLFK